MKLSPAGFAVGAATIWGAAIFVIGGINSFVPGYGEPVLALVVSLYPGYHADGTLTDLLLGTGYALFDGLAAGFVFALLYNAVVSITTRVTAEDAVAAETTETAEATETTETAETTQPPPPSEETESPGDDPAPEPGGHERIS